MNINVYANPYAGGYRSLDANGDAGCYVPILFTGRLIGAVLVGERMVPSLSPVAVPVSGPSEFAYYRQALLDGYLIAADADSARAMNVARVEHEETIRSAHATAVAEWRAEHGTEPACAGDFETE